MESATFRKWLAERGCRFARHEHKRGDGQSPSRFIERAARRRCRLGDRTRFSTLGRCIRLVKRSVLTGRNCPDGKIWSETERRCWRPNSAQTVDGPCCLRRYSVHSEVGTIRKHMRYQPGESFR